MESNDKERAFICEQIEEFFSSIGIGDMNEIQYDPGGEPCALDAPHMGWREFTPEQGILIRAWEHLSSERLRHQSDEPDYDAETAAERKERSDKAYMELK